MIELAGSTDLACHLVFEVEREYWQSRNTAARVQKARQDRLGLGWANHDHHTFRCSRRFFPRVIGMFTRLGFELRERFHAGAHAGWGAQILEQPVTGIVIFADLDLAPEEATEDFAHQALPDLPRPGTVGLWVALHGESILEAGMHHLEAQFDFDALRDGLKAEAGIETMPPFSNFPFLRQAFTAGERWPVDRGTGGPRTRSLGGSPPWSTRSSFVTGRSAATWRTWSGARVTRASTSRPSARSSRRPIPGSTESGPPRPRSEIIGGTAFP